MKHLVILICVLLIACDYTNLNAPSNANKVSSISCTKPDRNTNGKFALYKELKENEIKILLDELKTAKPIGLVKFLPECFIDIEMKNGKSYHYRISGNTLKDFNSDFGFEINEIDFLKDFNKE